MTSVATIKSASHYCCRDSSYTQVLWKRLGESLWGTCGKMVWKKCFTRKNAWFCGKSGACTHFLHGDLHVFYTWFNEVLTSVRCGDLHSFHIAYYYYY